MESSTGAAQHASVLRGYCGVRGDGNGGLFQFAGARGPGIDHDATLRQSAPFGDPENLAVKTEKPPQLRRLIFGSHPNGKEKRYRPNCRRTRGGHNHFGAQLNLGFTRYASEAKNLRANVGLFARCHRAGGAGLRQNIEKLLTVKPLHTGARCTLGQLSSALPPEQFARVGKIVKCH